MRLFLLSFILLASASAVFAHPDGGVAPLADVVRDRSILVALWAGGTSVLLLLIAILAKNASDELKKLLFALMITAIVGPTVYFIGSTVYLNLNSLANGPVHWHADFEIMACGEELSPPTPTGFLSNKTGTPVLHQHADKRYHVEGVVLDLEEVALDRFFEVQGGLLTNDVFRVPTGSGFVTHYNGDTCPNGEKGMWQAFLYKVDEATHTATQIKLADYAHYTPSPHELVPPGDCIIFEFGPERTYTDRLCNFHQIAVNKGELKIEVPAKEQAGVSPASGEQGAIDTSDWKTYRNDKFGYLFIYPSDLTLHVFNEGEGLRFNDSTFVPSQDMVGSEVRSSERTLWGGVTAANAQSLSEIRNELSARAKEDPFSPTIDEHSESNGAIIEYLSGSSVGPDFEKNLITQYHVFHLYGLEEHHYLANSIMSTFTDIPTE